jgi:fructokinase
MKRGIIIDIWWFSTNVAMNATRLGLNTVLVATEKMVLVNYIARTSINGINTSYLNVLEDKSTSVIFVSRSEGT